MPRIQIIFLSILLSANALAATPAKSAACGDRLKGFAIYEMAEKEKIVKKTAIFEILDWSRHSSFEGIVAKNSEPKDISVEVEFRKTKTGKAVQKKEAKFKSWPENKEYKIADMDPKSVIGAENVKEHFFVLRLKQGDKILCADQPREIQLGD